MNIKNVKTRIKDSGSVLTMDAGLLYKWDNGLSAGFAAQNLFGKLRIEHESDRLPLIMRFGTATEFRRNGWFLWTS